MKRTRLFKKLLIINVALLINLSVAAQIQKSAEECLLNDAVVGTGHIGIAVFDPLTNTYLYNYNAAKNFMPASNVKLFTLYAGMKYLGDSLKGIRYTVDHLLNDSVLSIYPTGDPTFLHPDFIKQPVYDFLKRYKNVAINTAPDPVIWGSGWAWDDYREDFMTPRSAFPIYGNIIEAKWISKDSINITPSFFSKTTSIATPLDSGFELKKEINANTLSFFNGNEKKISIPFNCDISTAISLLKDTLRQHDFSEGSHGLIDATAGVIKSQPVDSLFRPMMHRSDNFFAEQTLLMVSNEKLGYMSDEAIIDTLLKTDLKDLVQKPRWVDGSGLSRYNLFTPQSFVYILNKMKNEFGVERMKLILPTGGEGTLKNYYQKYSGRIYAKTGSFTNNNSLSGYLFTKKGKTLIFSVMVNNFQGSATTVKRSIEAFLEEVINKY